MPDGSARGRGRIRLLALDVDGTLLTSGHVVTARVAAAVRRAAEAGLAIVLSSARPPRGLLPVLAGLAGGPGTTAGRPEVVTAFVASQGALTGRFESDGTFTVLAREPMPAAAALACIRSVPAGVSANWYTGERWLVERMDPVVEQEASIVGFAPEVVDLSGPVGDPDKLLLLVPRERPELLDRVVAPPGLVAVRSTATHLEVNRAGVDKATALAQLCARLGFAPDEVAAMGDGSNDLPMLRWAGLALAPANAVPEVRAGADIVTSSNDADGVAEAIGRLLDS